MGVKVEKERKFDGKSIKLILLIVVLIAGTAVILTCRKSSSLEGMVNTYTRNHLGARGTYRPVQIFQFNVPDSTHYILLKGVMDKRKHYNDYQIVYNKYQLDGKVFISTMVVTKTGKILDIVKTIEQ